MAHAAFDGGERFEQVDGFARDAEQPVLVSPKDPRFREFLVRRFVAEQDHVVGPDDQRNVVQCVERGVQRIPLDALAPEHAGDLQ
ncbi:MAG: hypothetical protein DCC72_02175 [Burkholderiales bacterium]|nr:MAG: hypothetical protein DCC72_02175 [Burkholderiales bacterium]